MKKPKPKIPPAPVAKPTLVKIKMRQGRYQGCAALFDDYQSGCQFIIVAADSGMLQRATNRMKVKLDVKRVSFLNVNLSPV